MKNKSNLSGQTCELNTKKRTSGTNIRRRADGSFEARYIKERDADGKIKWGSCYGATYEIAEEKRNRVLAERTTITGVNLLILGAGSHGQEVYEMAKSLRLFGKISFLDDDEAKQEGSVIGKCENFSEYREQYAVAIPAVGNDALRLKWTLELTAAGFVIPTFIHPLASVSSSAEIGVGTVIYPGATVGIGASIGRACIIASGAIIDKNVNVPDWTWIECGEIVRSDIVENKKHVRKSV